MDDACHRSFFSNQTLTALGLASKDPHVFVSFLHYACTGAEIFDGVLVPQNGPSASGGYRKFAQINAAIRDLCSLNYVPYVSYNRLANIEGRDGKAIEKQIYIWTKPSKKISAAREYIPRVPRKDFHRSFGFSGSSGREADRPHQEQRDQSGSAHPHAGISHCPEGALRIPDRILLSVGGNDVGFADIVRYYAGPAEFSLDWLPPLRKALYPKICPVNNFRFTSELRGITRHCEKVEYHAGDIITKPNFGMEERYQFLFAVLRKYLKVESRDIAMLQIPDPLRGAHTPVDELCQINPEGNEV